MSSPPPAPRPEPDNGDGPRTEATEDAIEPAIVDTAIAWYSHLASGQAPAADWRACDAWRASDPRHEQAWQRLQDIAGQIQQVARDPRVPTRRIIGESSERLASRRRALKTLATLAAGGAGFWWAGRHGPLPDYLADHRTAPGEQRTVQLADGVELLLNGATTIDIHSRSDGTAIKLREGDLRIDSSATKGTGALEVATGHGTIFPVGTRFAVRHYPNAPRTRVAVLDGAVQLQPAADNAQRLAAGQESGFDRESVSPPRALSHNTTAWTRKLLVAERRRLGDFLTELARHRPGWLTWDETIADLRLTGTFPLARTNHTLAAVENTLPVRVRYLTRYWVRVEPI